MPSMKIPVVGTGVDTSATGNESATPPAALSKPGDHPRYLSQIPRAEQSLHSFHLKEGEGQVTTEEPGNSFHPDLDPSKFDISFDQFGRISRSPKAAVAEVESDLDPAEVVEDAQATLAHPPAGTQTNEVEALRNHINQLTQVVLGMNQQSTQKATATTAPPDYSEIDMYDPAQAAELVRRVVQDTMGEVVKTHIEPQVSRMDHANAQTQVNQILDKYGREVVESRGPLLMELSKSNPTSSVQELWNLADTLVGPIKAGTAKVASPSQAARTLTPQQAAQKAEQAKRLTSPGSNSGVSGASRRTGPPERMLKNLALGSIAAWNSLNKGT